MDRHIRKFRTLDEYNAYMTANPKLSNVSYCVQTDQVYYTQLPEPVEFNPWETVDLGLPSGTLWMKYNLEAEEVYEYGYYYQWASLVGREVEEARYYANWDSTPFNGGSHSFDTAYWESVKSQVVNGKFILSDYDVIYQNSDGACKLATEEQVTELCTLTYEWVTDYQGSGVNGSLFHGNNGNSLFIPAGGYINGTYTSPGKQANVYDVGVGCYIPTNRLYKHGDQRISILQTSSSSAWFQDMVDRNRVFNMRGVAS